MGIILRFILRNIREKKLRSVLIIFSVALSSALYFGTTGMSTTIQKMYITRLRQYFGTAEIMVFSRDPENPANRFFSRVIPREFVPRIEYSVGGAQANAQLKTEDEIVDLTVHGFDFPELQMMNPVTLIDAKALFPFSGKMVIIGLHTAEKYGFSVGDSVRIDIQGGTHRFRIAGIAESTGFLTDDGLNTAMIVPLSTIASIFDARGRVSMVYIKAKNPDDSEQLRKDMVSGMKRHFVRETVSREDIAQWAQDTAIPFRIMLVLTLAMSVFIIFTCFQVITIERLPVIGTFRSIGATRRTTDAVLLSEAFLYGVIGGVIGGALGIGVMYIMTYLNTGGWLSQTGIQLSFTPWQLIQAFLLAVILAAGSALIPIIRVSRLPVKDVILNTVAHAKGRPLRRLIAGFLFLAVGMITPFFVPISVSLVVISICILFVLASIVLLVPFITGQFSRLLQKVYQLFFGNVGLLASRNLSNNRSILHNIALLAIGISSLYMINTISGSVMKSLANLYRDAEYDIQVWAWPPDKNLEMKIRTVPGVTETYGIYGAYGIKLPEHNDEITFVHGIDKDKYGEYWDVHTTGERDSLFSRVQLDRYIVLSYTLQRRLDLSAGDVLLLDFGRRKNEYEIIGFFNTLMWNGNYGLIGERFLKLDSGQRYYSDLYVKTDRSPDEVAESIRTKLARKRPWVTTMSEMESRDRESNSDMFFVLKGFSFMTLLIGIVGVLNNYLLSFLERKRSFALFRSVGMSKRQSVKMVFLEALSGGLVGGFTGLIAGLLILAIVPQLFDALRLPVLIVYSGSAGIVFVVIGMLISLCASVVPALKTSKLNIIEALRYE